jgi:hypothetical protein
MIGDGETGENWREGERERGREGERGNFIQNVFV